jgi:hypothetical protein
MKNFLCSSSLFCVDKLFFFGIALENSEWKSERQTPGSTFRQYCVRTEGKKSSFVVQGEIDSTRFEARSKCLAGKLSATKVSFLEVATPKKGFLFH